MRIVSALTNSGWPIGAARHILKTREKLPCNPGAGGEFLRSDYWLDRQLGGVIRALSGGEDGLEVARFAEHPYRLFFSPGGVTIPLPVLAVHHKRPRWPLLLAWAVVNSAGVRCFVAPPLSSVDRERIVSLAVRAILRETLHASPEWHDALFYKQNEAFWCAPVPGYGVRF